MKGKKKKAAPRKAPKLDLTKPVKVASSSKPRTKGGIYQTIAEHVGIARRDVAGVFHTLGSMIRTDLKAGAGVFKVPV
jgi:hypothetical protein